MKLNSIYIMLLISVFTGYSQVGIGTTSPNASLDIPASNIVSPVNTDGLLIPRVNAFPATSPGINQNGMLVFLNNTVGIKSKGFYYWDFSLLDWISVGNNNTSGWSLNGNAGTVASTNFIGTTDNVDFRVRTNGNERFNFTTNGRLRSMDDGLPAQPTYSWNSATGLTMGMYRIGANNLGFSTNSLERLRIESNGNVGIGNAPNASAVLDVNDANKGVLIPRVALTAKNNASPVTAPATSLLVYNTATAGTAPNNVIPGYFYWNGTVWVEFSTATNSKDWSLTGNAGTSAATNFLGTTDNIDVVFRRNNGRAGLLGTNNTSYGNNSLNTASTGAQNTAIGSNILTVNTSGRRNTAIGESTMFSNTTGGENVAIGTGTLYSNTQGNYNTAVGRNAMTTNDLGEYNTAIGYRSLYANTAGGYNTSMGTDNLRYNTTGEQNSSIGVNALYANSTGSYNSNIGVQSLRYNSSGNYNTALGFQSLYSNSTGSFNVGLGNKAGYFETGSNKLYIENSNANANAALIYGEFDNDILRVNGTLQISNPATANGYALPIVRGTNGQVLQTDGAGATNWVSASALSITEADPQVSATATNAVTRWNGTTLVDGTMQDDGTNVGIGVAPNAGNKLEVNGKTQTTNFQMTAGATNGYILQSDAAGNASWVPNPLNTLSVVRTNLSANQSLATTGWQKITFDTVVFDVVGSEFVTGTNQFVATKTGYYEVNAGFHTNDQSNLQFYSIGVFKNGSYASPYQENTGNHFGNGPVSRTINCIVFLNAGEFVEIFAQNYQTGVNIDAFSSKTYFEVKQIR